MEGLSPYILDQITAGQAVLFLGAGASISAISTTGGQGLSGNQLRNKLCEKFLGGEGKTKPLNYIADRSVAVAGMAAVHRYLKDLFGGLNPTEGHLLVPEFRWRGIVTSNYDLLVERAYERNTKPQQHLERIIWDRDDFDGIARNPDAVAYLKLHGCLNRLNDPELPLVLSSHDYYKFKTNRGQLVSTLREWGTCYPILFCGYSISDENIKEILFDISDKYLNRPQYVLIDPGLEKGDIDYWKSNRFDCIPLCFDDFMRQLREVISPAHVSLGKIPHHKLSVSKLIPSHAEPSASLTRYLDDEALHIHATLVTSLIPPKDFYRGNSEGFAWISEKFDVRRRVVDTLIEDLILASGKIDLQRPYFYVLCGYAGSGKSVVLKRFAWEAANEYGGAIFYVGANSVLRVNEFIELARLISTRIVIVLDDALVNKDDIKRLIGESKRLHLPITILSGARTNEWNVMGGELNAELEAEYNLLDLNHSEVQLLIEKLATNKCLGYLEHLSSADRTVYFLDKLKSQLLVALHEATEGKSFEEIVYDEYQRITPTEARLLYLDVCTLDRFDVGVRAGLVSRISGVTFEQFSNKLLRPLEHVILVHYDHRAGDYLYRSRHQHIAELVFDAALSSQADRAAQIVKIVKYLNGGYESDRIALQRLIKGRLLATQFSDKAFVAQIFEAALESGMHPSVVDHQRAVFEVHHPRGDLRSALSIIGRIELNPGIIQSKTLAHTKANILRRLASTVRTELERSRYRQDALVILNTATKAPKDALPFFTKGQILLEQLQERMQQVDDGTDDEVDVRVVGEMTKEIEGNLRQGLQYFPEDERLLSFEADLSCFLNNSPRALRALERAYAKNRQSVFTTIRLARQYLQSPDTKDKAFTMMRKLASEQPISKEAHFELARMLIQLGESESQNEIGQHLKRSFSSGDSRYEARFLYARHEFLYGNLEKSKSEFSSLGRISLSPNILNQVRAEICDALGECIYYDGIIKSVHDSFAFVRCSNFHDDIFMHFKAFSHPHDWDVVRAGDKIRFSLGFSYKGPKIKRATLVRH